MHYFAIQALEYIKSDLCGKNVVNVQDFILCGHEKSTILLSALQEQQSEQTYSKFLSELCEHAHDAMKSSQYDPPLSFAWRRLYTDASLVWALRDCLNEKNSPSDESLWQNVIHNLDRAIIIAGAPGKGRLDLILDTIDYIQKMYLSIQATPPAYEVNLGKVQKESSLKKNCKLASAALSIPILEVPPSLATFHSLSQSPFILRGFALDWPAIQKWVTKDYLLKTTGRGRIVPIEVGGDYRTDDWTQRFISWEEFLDYLTAISDTGMTTKEILYLAQYDLFKQFPDLRNDIIVPDYVYTSLSPPEYYSQYCPPKNEDQLVLNTWIGPSNTASPAHIDPFFNIYTQVVGQKLVWLAPPDVSEHVSPYSSVDSNMTSLQDEDGRNLNSLLGNTSRLDVFANEDELGSTFKKTVTPVAMSAVLEAGDVLFFPPGWWHAMRSESVSFSVSMWF